MGGIPFYLWIGVKNKLMHGIVLILLQIIMLTITARAPVTILYFL